MLATAGLWRCARITQPQGGPKRLTAAGCHHDDTGIRHCRFQREEGLYRIQRIRTAQGSAKGVLHLSFHEKDTARLAQGTRHPGRHQGYLAAEPNLLAQFRPQCGRQQRRQPLHGTALCLFDRFRNRFVDDVGLFGGCLHERYGGQRIPFVLRPESGFGTRTGLDRIPIQAAGRRPGIPQRHLPGREPQTDGLPRLCARRQQRQPAIRSGRRPGSHFSTAPTIRPRCRLSTSGTIRLACICRPSRKS